jgi:hypothetical protein
MLIKYAILMKLDESRKTVRRRIATVFKVSVHDQGVPIAILLADEFLFAFPYIRNVK